MSDFIPVQHAEIFFNRDESGGPSQDVFVCDRRLRKIGTSEQIYMSQFKSSYGAVYTNWMVGGEIILTPEGVFATEWLNSTIRPTLEAMKAALREFGKIDRCEWARIMFASIKDNPAYGSDGEEQYD